MFLPKAIGIQINYSAALPTNNWPSLLHSNLIHIFCRVLLLGSLTKQGRFVTKKLNIHTSINCITYFWLQLPFGLENQVNQVKQVRDAINIKSHKAMDTFGTSLSPLPASTDTLRGCFFPLNWLFLAKIFRVVSYLIF